VGSVNCARVNNDSVKEELDPPAPERRMLECEYGYFDCDQAHTAAN